MLSLSMCTLQSLWLRPIQNIPLLTLQKMLKFNIYSRIRCDARGNFFGGNLFSIAAASLSLSLSLSLEKGSKDQS